MRARHFAQLVLASLVLFAAFMVLPRPGASNAPRVDVDPAAERESVEDGAYASDAPAEHVPGAAIERGPDPAAERERIREHLRGAERQLRDADVSHLSPAQRERRAHVIELLREYREAGVFPHNHDFPDERVPYFVDEHGTHCAMAYLIARTGGEELAERVARTANNATVPELAADPAFRDWLDRYGMTVAEAARVQPMYGPWPSADETETSYAIASAGSAALSGAAVVLQLTDEDEVDTWRSAFGLAAGGIGIGMGVAGLRGPERNDPLAGVNLGLGGVTLGTVAWRLLSGDRTSAAAEQDEQAGFSWSAQPALSRDGRAGVGVTIRF